MNVSVHKLLVCFVFIAEHTFKDPNGLTTQILTNNTPLYIFCVKDKYVLRGPIIHVVHAGALELSASTFIYR
jgi:hypothetical protein